MDAYESTPPKGQEDSGTDDEQQTDSALTRRMFVAAAVALGLVPATASQPASASRVDVNHGDWGGHSASIEPGDPIYGTVDITDFQSEETTFSVKGYAYDDSESNDVECYISLDGVCLTLSFSPERAHELAEEIHLAADYAEQMGDN